MWGDDSDEDEEPQQVEQKTNEVVKGPEEIGTKSADTIAKTDEPTEEQKAEAATKIQAVQRGKAARQEMQAKQEAATKIQAVQRGKMARNAVKQEVDEPGGRKQEDLDESGGWGAEDDEDKYAQKSEGSYAQKEATESRPPPRKQQAPKEAKTKPAKTPVRSDGNAYVVSHRERTMEQSKHGQARIKQRILEAPSSQLIKKSCLKRLKLPLGIPSIPIIVVMGDLASLDDDPQRKMLDYFSQGILRAAASVDGLVVDSGLASGPCACSPAKEYVDFVRKVCILGISPTETDEPLSRYHTHQLVVSDFKGFEKEQGQFVKHKMGMIRRLAGTCRVVGVFINNGHTAFTEIVEFTRYGFPTVVLEGSGDLADEICESIASNRSDNLHVKELLDSKRLMKLDKSCNPADLAALLQLCLTVDLVGLNRLVKAK